MEVEAGSRYGWISTKLDFSTSKEKRTIPHLWKTNPGQMTGAWLLIVAVALWLPSFSTFCAASPDGDSLIEIATAWGVSSALPTWVPGSDPCVKWEGVACDSQGLHVTYLNLTNRGLRGPIPPVIANLTSLSNLDLSNSKSLNGTWNSITGDLQALSTLASLQFLNLSYNYLGSNNSFPAAVLGLTNLVTLRLDHCGIIGQFPATISNLFNLQYVYLGNNSMTGPLPKELGLLVNLLELSMWQNNFDSDLPPDLQYIKQLQYLNLHECNLWGGLPPEWGNWIYVQRILLYRNSLTGPIPDRWSNMGNLTDLRLDANFLYSQVKPWVLQLPSVKNIYLGSNLLYGAFPNVTATKAQVVRLDCNYLTGALPNSQLNISLYNNCFSGTLQNDSANLVCTRQYTCTTFEQNTSNGTCPDCPTSQALYDPSLCICHIVDAAKKSSIAVAGPIAGPIAAAVVIIPIGLFLLFRSWKHKRTSSADPFDPDKPDDGNVYWEAPQGVQKYTYQEVEKATAGFHKDHEIGLGAFGKVFIGTFEDGRTLAVKRASATGSQGLPEFRNEVLLLSRLHHKNLVRLEGFCEEKQILVYEYMKLGNLHNHLFRSGNTGGLDWLKRLDIAVGIARALEYLHTHADPPVIHRDVKPSNVLLADTLIAKVSDFGISRTSSLFDTHISTYPAGTAGYFDPQYFLRHQLTTASDVYSFGVVLLELVTGQKAIDHNRGEANLRAWYSVSPLCGHRLMYFECFIYERIYEVIPKLRQTGIESIVDPFLKDEYPRDIFYDMADLALKCTSLEIEDRPTMRTVLAILEPVLHTHKGPTPALSPPTPSAPAPPRRTPSWLQLNTASTEMTPSSSSSTTPTFTNVDLTKCMSPR